MTERMVENSNKLNTRNARMTLNAYFDFWLETFAKSGRKATTCTNYKSYYNTDIRECVERTGLSGTDKKDRESEPRIHFYICDNFVTNLRRKTEKDGL